MAGVTLIYDFNAGHQKKIPFGFSLKPWAFEWLAGNCLWLETSGWQEKVQSLRMEHVATHQLMKGNT